MASSDDEGETVSHSVANYHFVDDKDEPITFSDWPIKWAEDESLDPMTKQIFLRGTADSGLQKIYKQVTAWKLDISNEQPEISVLCKENYWIKLQKPRKSYEDTIRTILITVHVLHFVKNKPEASGKTLWDHLKRVFSLYEPLPSENDLLDHLPLVREMVKRYKALAKSKFLNSFLENPKKRKVLDQEAGHDEKRSKFIVEDDESFDEDIVDESDEDLDLFDSVCAICDNGGEILCCEGKCLRSFHATKDAGVDSDCASLGMSKAEVKAIQNFYCTNCLYKKHQCFACGKLGSSDRSAGAEVFPCVSATCGHFYHPECVAKLLHPGNEAQAEEQLKKIASGESFTCPVHKCYVCNQRENKEIEELQFAICRRCPRAYHRKCLPSEIAFEDSEDEDIVTRAWERLIPNRILIYCLRHKIDEELKTPIRNHIKFPEIAKKKKLHPLDSQTRQGKAVVKKKNVISEGSSKGMNMVKMFSSLRMAASAVEGSVFKKKTEKPLSAQGIEPSKKLKASGSFKSLKESVKPVLPKEDKSFDVGEDTAFVTEERSPSSVRLKGYEAISVRSKGLSSKPGKIFSPASALKRSSSSVSMLDTAAEKKIIDLMRTVSSSLTLEDIINKQRTPSTYSYARTMDKAITEGKVEGSVEAIRAALQKLEEGYSIEDAKAVCEPRILNQIIKWKNKLKVYLAPFLHGMRYTSFGRHFTKVDKLKEIVDKLHWYVLNGDMIVDFCCGANDFSHLIKGKLEETGKKCSFKNYDLIQPKNDFNFEKRDWMEVRPTELPTGSQLIMGLNPPFGVKASLANQFINKALQFKPKLLILIVPRETQRLDQKEVAYDLIWEDDSKLSGKSFYLPGSVDVDDKQIEQWNMVPPLLYLWSRHDWTSRHKAIAAKKGHLSNSQLDKCNVQESLLFNGRKEKLVSDNWEDDASKGDTLAKLPNMREQNDHAEEFEEERTAVSEQKNKVSSSKQDSQVGMNTGKKDANREGSTHKSKKQRVRECKQSGRSSRIPKSKHNRVRAEDNEILSRTSSPHNKIVPKMLSGGPSETLVVPAERDSTMSLNQWQTGNAQNYSGFGAACDRSQASVRDEDLDDITRRYSVKKEETFSSGNCGWPASSSIGADFRFPHKEEQFSGYVNDSNVDSFSQKAYLDELSLTYGMREADVRGQYRLYSQQENDLARRPYSLIQDSGLSNRGPLSSSRFGLSVSTVDPSGLSSPVVQKYPLHLDEVNYVRSNTFVSGLPIMGSSVYDPLGPQRGPPPGFPAETQGFARGPQRPFSHHGSAGWLNE